MKCPKNFPDCKSKEAIEYLASRQQYLEAKYLTLEATLREIKQLIIEMKDYHDE